MGPTVVVLVVLVVVALVFLASLSRLIKVGDPNQVLIYSGTTRRLEERTVGYRIVRGGTGVRVPLLEQLDTVELSNIPIEVAVIGAYSKGGIALNVHGIANVKIPGQEPLLNNAIERFLGYGRDEIARIAKETLEGNLRGVLAQLTPEQVNEDKEAFGRMLLEEAEHDMARIGLALDNLKIQNITDDSGYLNSIGRIRGSTVRQTATIAEAEAQADAALQQARNWAAAEVAKLEAELQIAGEETKKRIADAQSRRGALIAEAQGEVRTQLVSIRAEIERERARMLTIKRQLEADVVVPAEAECRAQEERARGEAATILERGKAEAQSLKALIDSYKQAGPAAREVLALQKMIPMLSAIAGADQPISIRRLTVLPDASSAPGGDMARGAVGAMEQIRAATGVDIGAAVRRLGEGTPPAPPKTGK